MLTPCRRLAVACVAIAALSLFNDACQRVPLLAPTGSTITLSTAQSFLPGNGNAKVVIQIIEAAGTPPHTGTHVAVSTTLGHVEPDETTTDVNGRATVTFFAGGANGVAQITAVSGGATTGTDGALLIAVGTAAVGRVMVNANPSSVPALGGSSTISAVVLDKNGNQLVAVPVTFTTNAGTLSALVVQTNLSGIASSVLTTTATATVTASVGAQVTTGTGENQSSSGQASGTVTVNVTNAPTISITPPATAQKGLAATFTFTVTAAAANGAAVKDVTVNWGDGQTQSLGAFVGGQVVSHLYNADGPFTVSATVTDAVGNSNSVSTTVVVTQLAKPSVVVTATPTMALHTASIVVTITPPTGVGIVSTSINYGEGPPDELGGATSVTKPHQYSGPGTFVIVVTVVDTLGRTTTGSTTVTVT